MRDLDDLTRTIASGEAILFTGAGFSADARDLDGAPLPDSRQMVCDLWPLCFDEPGPDDSTLPDVYDVALMRAPERLCDYVARRLQIGMASLPVHLARWFAAPWRRIYTLNVDDLEVAIQRQYTLPHRLRPRSATRDEPAEGEGAERVVDVVHLNGLATDGARELTFSTLQYAARLCTAADRAYSELAADLLDRPFVFAGTTLDEAMLWQHLELHRRRSSADFAHRPPSFLVARSLSRARQVLLENLQIRWVRAAIADIADYIDG